MAHKLINAGAFDILFRIAAHFAIQLLHIGITLSAVHN